MRPKGALIVLWARRRRRKVRVISFSVHGQGNIHWKKKIPCTLICRHHRSLSTEERLQPQLERGQCIFPTRKGPCGVLNPNSKGHTKVWVWLWVSLAPTIEEHRDSVNALCNHEGSPLEHRHIESEVPKVGMTKFIHAWLMPYWGQAAMAPFVGGAGPKRQK